MRLQVTDLGSFVVKYGVMTEPSEWLRIARQVDRMADQDADWEFFLGEKIAGLEEMLVERRKRGELWAAPSTREAEKP